MSYIFFLIFMASVLSTSASENNNNNCQKLTKLLKHDKLKTLSEEFDDNFWVNYSNPAFLNAIALSNFLEKEQQEIVSGPVFYRRVEDYTILSKESEDYVKNIRNKTIWPSNK